MYNLRNDLENLTKRSRFLVESFGETRGVKRTDIDFKEKWRRFYEDLDEVTGLVKTIEFRLQFGGYDGK